MSNEEMISVFAQWLKNNKTGISLKQVFIDNPNATRTFITFDIKNSKQNDDNLWIKSQDISQIKTVFKELCKNYGNSLSENLDDDFDLNLSKRQYDKNGELHLTVLYDSFGWQ